MHNKIKSDIENESQGHRTYHPQLHHSMANTDRYKSQFKHFPIARTVFQDDFEILGHGHGVKHSSWSYSLQISTSN